MDNDLKKLHTLLVRIDREVSNIKGKKVTEGDDISIKYMKNTNERLRRIENQLKVLINSLKTIKADKKSGSESEERYNIN